ncbi:N-acetylmuramoyl-L-alanine amidase [Bacillus massiliigorillae]|uniref:N-acetylmuramoyl-L-alanine amidase n=1 Tax=Bacillus massiliigorillae TaxID=1243664 RepID=UPI0003A24B6B|nr:N-acetylmuramoyl-L-alanine amidase [Bacillus massiliigorillae]
MKKIVKLIVCMLVVTSTLFTAKVGMSQAATPTFTDVSTSYPLYAEINYLAQGGIVQGSGTGTFNPKNNITRAEFTAMLGRALGYSDSPQKTSFKDVGSNVFASGQIQQAVNNKIITGYSDGTFRPYQNITRGEMAMIISRAFGYYTGTSTSSAAQAILSRGIDVRQSDGSFAANRAGTREEMAIFLARGINYTLRKSGTIPTTFTETRYVNNVPANESLKIRKGPSTKYEIIEQLSNGDSVSIAYKVGNWSMIKASNGTTGFVSNKYLSNSASTTPPSSSTDKKQISSLTLVLDAGHGIQPGKKVDPGAIGNGLRESDITLDVTQRMKKILDQTPMNVLYTRPFESYPTLEERADTANQNNADAFVSVHVNSAENTSASGTETLIKPASTRAAMSESERAIESKKLGNYIRARFIKAWDMKDRSSKDRTDLAVLNLTKMPATIVEMGFISNKDDAAKLASDEYRQLAAQAIYEGILDYFGSKGYDVDSYYNIH